MSEGNRLGIVYKITNKLNNKVYIGQTIRSLKTRLYEHTHYKNQANYIFHNTLQKYGMNNFTAEIIESDIPKNKLTEREIYWTEFYKATDRRYGYNLILGQKKNCCQTYAWKAVYQFDLDGNLIKKWNHAGECAQWLINNNISKSKEYRYVVSTLRSVINKYSRFNKKTNKFILKHKSYCGYLWSYNKNIKPYKKNSLEFENISVKQYDLQGNLIKEYKDVYEIEKVNKNFKINSIICNLHHKSVSSYNYQWRWADDKPDKIDINYKYLHLDRPIYVYDLNWNFIKEFKSAKEAGEILKINPVMIRDVLRKRIIPGHGMRQQSHGYRFEYKDSAEHYMKKNALVIDENNSLEKSL